MPADKVYIEASGSGTVLTIAAPTAPGFIRVQAYHLSAPAGVAKCTWKSGSNTLFSDYPSATGGPVEVVDNQGVIDANPGEQLTLTTDAAVGGVVRYNVVGN